MWADLMILAVTWSLVAVSEAMVLKGHGLVLAGVLTAILLFNRYEWYRRRTDTTPLAPELHERLRSICAEAGRPDLQPAALPGAALVLEVT